MNRERVSLDVKKGVEKSITYRKTVNVKEYDTDKYKRIVGVVTIEGVARKVLLLVLAIDPVGDVSRS
jgi:hypothetical protein